MADQSIDISMDPGTPASPHTRQQRKKVAPQRPRPSKQQPEQKNWIESLVEKCTGDRFRYGLGFTLTIIAVAMALFLISFLKSGALDESLVESLSVSQVADAPEGVANAGGAFGAVLSHILFVDGLGIGSFILIFYVTGLALALFRLVKIKFWTFTFKCLFTAVALSVIIGLLTYNSDSFLHWGGNHGRYVNQWLYHVSDVIGAYIVTIFLIGMLVIMYFNQLRSVYGKLQDVIAKSRQNQPVEDDSREISLNDLPEDDESGRGFSQIENIERIDNIVSEPAKSMIQGFSIDDDTDNDPQQIDAPNPSYSDPEFNIVSAHSDDEIDGDSGEFGDLTTGGFEPFDIRDELSHYQFPTPDLLIDRPVKDSVDITEQEENKRQIVDTLKTYNIPIARIDATIGPTVTRYEILPEEGVRIAQIKRLEDDIARSLAALGIRIIAPIPGTSNIGIEVPNRDPQTVSMRSVITSKKFRETNMALPMALGKTIKNEIFIADLAKMPHLLVAGGTGQGKSVGLNCIIASLLYKKHPGELKFVLIDPKQLEFALYDKIEHHFLAKLPDEEDAIITDPNKALETLSSICVEMDNRYSLLKKGGVRNIEEYNRKFTERRLNPEKGHHFMPYLVVIVDEFADLISTVGKDILLYISRIVAKARAAGIHMIIATQRPSTDVINGVIKSNFLGRIAFRVMQRVDSQTILDQPGANRLIGRGDMLFSHNSTMERVQCAFIDTPEVEALVEHIDNQIGYPTAYILPEPEREGSAGAAQPGAIDLSRLDEQFPDCARFAVQNGACSTSLLQRRFGIGYAKAGKIMDQLQAAGIVGPQDGQRPRAILVDQIQVEDILRSLGC